MDQIPPGIVFCGSGRRIPAGNRAVSGRTGFRACRNDDIIKYVLKTDIRRLPAGRAELPDTEPEGGKYGLYL